MGVCTASGIFRTTYRFGAISVQSYPKIYELREISPPFCCRYSDGSLNAAFIGLSLSLFGSLV